MPPHRADGSAVLRFNSRLAVVALLSGIGLLYVASAQSQDVNFTGDFESGQIRSNGSPYDGFYLATLPDPQSGTQFLTNQKSDFSPSSHADTRVVASESVGGQTVRPRKGRYFLRSEIFRNKNYLALNNFAKNRPRSKIYMSNSNLLVNYDEEGYLGFSIFTAQNFESERGVRDHRGSITLLTIKDTGEGKLLDLSQWVESPASEAHWWLRHYTVSDNGKGRVLTKVEDLGPVSADAGKWTDFVIRYRFNPFSRSTNPAAERIAGSMNKTFQGNKGILQVWKAQGAVDGNGNRSMALRVNKVNTPVGVVPSATKRIAHHFRIYKFGWLSSPTTLTHPVWIGFDEIRQGQVARDGTTFADVAPSTGS